MQTTSLTLTFDHVTWKSIRKFFSLGTSTATSLATLNQRGQMTPSGQYLYKDQQFDIRLRSCDLNIIKSHLLAMGIHGTKFDNFQAKGSKGIEQTFAQRSAVRPWPPTRKPTGNNHSPGASTTPSFATFKHWGQKTPSGHHLVHISTYWPT